MNANEIFEQMLKDPVLLEDYGLTEEQIAKLTLHDPSGSEIVEVIKDIVNGVEHSSPEASIYSRISTHFGI